jgi:hypothetical protein
VDGRDDWPGSRSRSIEAQLRRGEIALYVLAGVVAVGGEHHPEYS